MKRRLFKQLLVCLVLIQASVLKSQHAIEWVERVGFTETNGLLTKTDNGSTYNAGSSSLQILKAGQDGYAEFEVTQTGKKLAFGVSQLKKGIELANIEYSVELNTNNKIKLYNSGKLLGTFGNYKTGDKIRIERKGLNLEFYNGKVLLKRMELLYKDHPLVIKLALSSPESSIKNHITSFEKPLTINPVVTDISSLTGELGKIVLNVSGGTPPYETYVKSLYNDAYILIPEGTISKLSLGAYTFYINDALKNVLIKDVTIYNQFNWIDSTGVVVTDSSLIKNTGVDSWTDAGAYSVQDLKENETGVLVHKISSLKYIYSIGLHNTAKPKSNYHYNTMEYSFMIKNRKLLIYKGNKLQIILATNLNIGDELMIQKTSSAVTFYHNGLKIYEQNIPFSYGVCAQVSLFKANTELKNIRTTFVRPIRIFYTQQDVNCVKGENGLITINPIGGVAPYLYQLDGGALNKDNFFKDLKAGTYTLKVLDRTKREAVTTITILNCPLWSSSTDGTIINKNGDIIKNGGKDDWESTNLTTDEPFIFAETPNWVSFKTPDTTSVFMLGFRSIDLAATAQTTNYKLFIENSVATVIETDNDGFYNKRQIKRITNDMGFKVQLTKTGIEYYIRNNSTSPYVLTYVSKLFSTATLIIENSIYKTGSKIGAIRVSDYGNTVYPSAE